MKLRVLILIACSCLLSFCKKEKQIEVPTTFEESPYTESRATQYAGFFATSISDRIYINNKKSVFFSSAVSFFDSQNTRALKVNSVKRNDRNLAFDFGDVYRGNWNDAIYDESWEVIGADEIPSFKYRNTNTMPGWKYLSMPDSLDLSKDFIIQVKQAGNIKEGQVYISGASALVITKRITNGAQSIIFKKDEIAGFANDESVFLSISVQNSWALNFYGKDFSFSKSRNYMRDFVVKPE